MKPAASAMRFFDIVMCHKSIRYGRCAFIVYGILRCTVYTTRSLRAARSAAATGSTCDNHDRNRRRTIADPAINNQIWLHLFQPTARQSKSTCFRIVCAQVNIGCRHFDMWKNLRHCQTCHKPSSICTRCTAIDTSWRKCSCWPWTAGSWDDLWERTSKTRKTHAR